MAADDTASSYGARDWLEGMGASVRGESVGEEWFCILLQLEGDYWRCNEVGLERFLPRVKS